MDQEKSFADVIRSALDNVQEIIRSEIRLAKTEFREEAGRAKRGAIFMGAGALCGLFALDFLLLALSDWLALYMAAWMAALIVGVVVAIAALILIQVARRYFRELRMVPPRTAATLKEDMRWAQQRAR